MFATACRLALAISYAALLSSCNNGISGGRAATTADGALSVISNRPDFISGDDALVELHLPQGKALDGISVSLNGQDVTAAFTRRADGRVLGLVTGLKLGANTLSSNQGDSLTITNHPNGGPIFSGPQVQPWVCQGSAVDAQCNQPAQYTYLYKSSDPTTQDLKAYDPANPPSDIVEVTSDNGMTMPFIVRQELGYQDRDQYKILTLFDPEQDWTAQAPQAQWSGKLLITHGGNCGAAHGAGSAPLDDYSGTIPANPLFEQSYVRALGKGYAVLTTALDNSGHNCNIAVQAESLLMGKERFVEQYGPLRYTLGTGCSGGSLVQQQIANAYPGIYQGILAMCSYPDVMGAGAQFTDFHLMRIYFEDPSRWGDVLWTPTQFADVEGHISHLDAIAADELLYKAALNPSNDCSGVSDEERFDQNTNPGGVRCDVLGYMINILGARDPSVWTDIEKGLGRGFAGIPISNVGIQYGLNALRQGLITPTHFVELNTRIGGLDVNMNWVPERLKADYPALSNMYRTGLSNMTTNMDRVAMINFTGNDPGIAHDTVHAYWTRWRMDREHGHHDNHIMWGGPAPLVGDLNFVYLGLDAMSGWLDAIEADLSNIPLSQKILKNKPADMTDRCSDGLGQFILDDMCPSPIVHYYGTPRTVAGDVNTADTMDCQLRPFSRDDDYGLIPFMEDQWTALETLFVDGVCDYSLPPNGMQSTVEWLGYHDAKGQAIVGGDQLPAAAYPAGWASPAFSDTWTRRPRD